MSRRRISGSIFWGLVLLVVGSLFLARNLGYSGPVWTLIVRYWPVLLIVWGLFKMVDYFRMEPTDTKQPLFSAGDVVTIVFVILFGSLITLAANMSPDMGKLIQMGDFDVWDLTGNNFSFSEQHVMDVPQDSAIEISNRFGDVDVMPSDTDRITLDVRKSIRAADLAEATRLSPELAYAITKEGSKYRIGTSFDRRLKASLTVHVPRRSIVSVENRNGSVSVKGLTGNQNITNRFGAIEVHDTTGSLNIENQNGEVRVENVSDSVTISSSFAPISVAKVRGELKINGRNSSVSVDQVEKDLNVESSFQNIDIRDPRGAITVNNRNGEISIRLQQAPKQAITVNSRFGDLNIELPAGSSFNVDAQAHFGDVSSDFEELRSTTQRSDHYLSGQVGSGGPAIKVESRNGAVRFRKRG